MQNNTVFPTKYQDQQISKTITQKKFLTNISLLKRVFNWPLLFDCPIEVQVVVQRLNREGRYGLEIPVNYHFYSQEKFVNWFIKKIEGVRKDLECLKVSKCFK